MLMKRYTVSFMVDDDMSPLIISNGVNYKIEYGNDTPNENELDAPGLIVKMRKSCTNEYESHGSILWEQFAPSYTDESCLPAEIIAAMQGKESDWRVVRCEVCPSHLFFLCINPKIWSPEHGEEFMSSLDADMKCGEVWVLWDYDQDAIIDIISPSGERYTIPKTSKGYKFNHLDFTEYLPDGRISRISHVEYDLKAETGIMTITEYSY